MDNIIKNKDNLVLTGMPGCGKSTCGVLVAKALCKEFVDTDLLIQTKEEKSLQDLIIQKGPDYLARTEEEVLSSLTHRNCVISTGGSAVYSEPAMSHLQKSGKIIYLRISFETMIARVKNITTRGILLRPGESLHDMYDYRQPLYEKYADVVIDCDDLTVEETVGAICDRCG